MKIGDIVRLKSGGPKMTVSKRNYVSSSEGGYYEIDGNYIHESLTLSEQSD